MFFVAVCGDHSMVGEGAGEKVVVLLEGQRGGLARRIIYKESGEDGEEEHFIFQKLMRDT